MSGILHKWEYPRYILRISNFYRFQMHPAPFFRSPSQCQPRGIIEAASRRAVSFPSGPYPFLPKSILPIRLVALRPPCSGRSRRPRRSAVEPPRGGTGGEYLRLLRMCRCGGGSKLAVSQAAAAHWNVLQEIPAGTGRLETRNGGGNERDSAGKGLNSGCWGCIHA